MFFHSDRSTVSYYFLFKAINKLFNIIESAIHQKENPLYFMANAVHSHCLCYNSPSQPFSRKDLSQRLKVQSLKYCPACKELLSPRPFPEAGWDWWSTSTSASQCGNVPAYGSVKGHSSPKNSIEVRLHLQGNSTSSIPPSFPPFQRCRCYLVNILTLPLVASWGTNPRHHNYQS